jgi:hypothetical protein
MKVKKFNNGGDTAELLTSGGAGADMFTGGLSALYGMRQLRKANQAFDKAVASAPSLETPSQYYENYKNAYDSELARIESEAMQSNLATSVQALQGAGGRALVGGLSASVSANQAARNKMLADERKLRLTAGASLASAEEKTRTLKYEENIRQQQQAQAAATAARQNIAGGLTNIATGVMFGGVGQIGAGLQKGLGFLNGLSKNEQTFLENAVKTDLPTLSVPEMLEFDDGEIVPDFVPDFPQTTPDLNLNQDAIAKQQAAEFEKSQEAEAVPRTDAVGVSGVGETGDVTPAQQIILDTPNTGIQGVNTTDEFIQLDVIDPETGEMMRVPNPDYGKTNEEIFGVESVEEKERKRKERQALTKAGQMYNRYGRIGAGGIKAGTAAAHIADEKRYNKIKPYLPYLEIVNKRFLKQGGMMTEGEFNHSTNPIDLVQNGVKVGEATGNEVILNPTQAKKIAKESSFARKLFKKFEKNARKK